MKAKLGVKYPSFYFHSTLLPQFPSYAFVIKLYRQEQDLLLMTI